MTKRQSQIMSAVLQYRWNHGGRTPSFRDISAAVGGLSLTTVYYHVHKLERAGYLQWDKVGGYRQPRAFKVLRMPGKVIRASDCEVIWRTINGKLVYVGGGYEKG